MITIHGREVGFTRNVGANIEISRLNPDGDFSTFGDVLAGMTFAEQMDTTIELVLILNRAYERQMKFEDPLYEGDPLTREELLLLNDDEFQAVTEAATAQFSADSKTTIEAEAKNPEGAGTPE